MIVVGWHEGRYFGFRAALKDQSDHLGPIPSGDKRKARHGYMSRGVAYLPGLMFQCFIAVP
jgi:hypothetical protein